MLHGDSDPLDCVREYQSTPETEVYSGNAPLDCVTILCKTVARLDRISRIRIARGIFRLSIVVGFRFRKFEGMKSLEMLH